MSRVTSGFWVAAYVRRLNAQNVFCVVERRGAEQGGAIFVKIVSRDGTVRLFAPAPQNLLEDDGVRRFSELTRPGQSEADIDARLAKEARFDPDFWLISVEDREGRHFLDDVIVG